MKNNTTIVKATLNITTLDQVQLSQVIEQLKDMSDSSLQICHNNYCIKIGYEDIIYDNDEYEINSNFDSVFDVLRNLQHYNLSDDYFYFHNGNLISFSYLTSEDSPITFSELAQWIIDNDLFNDYDITVTTIDDSYNAVLDYINDIDSVASIQALLGYLDIDIIYTNEWLKLSKNNTIDKYIENYINIVIGQFIDKDDNDQLEGLLEYFNY